jgi:Holliday junction DNA helicase RuvA
MIGYLKGYIIGVDQNKVTLLVSGVGYEVSLPNNTLSHINQEELVELYIYESIKEDSYQLYGFDTKIKKHYFSKLVSINGVGPKIGLALLSTYQLDVLSSYIQAGDVTKIEAVPGIGKKMAQKIIVEMKGAIDLSADTNIINNSDDAFVALTSLGYSPSQASDMLRGIDSELSTSSRVTAALKNKSSSPK